MWESHSLLWLGRPICTLQFKFRNETELIGRCWRRWHCWWFWWVGASEMSVCTEHCIGIIWQSRNCKMKSFVWTIQGIFRMLNQFAVEIPTTSDTWRIVEAFLRIAAPQRRAAKHLEYTWYIGKRFCKSTCIFISSLRSRIETMECVNRGIAPFIHRGEKWKTRTKSRSEMSVWTVSQRFSPPQWRGLFKELWDRPTTADFGSSSRQVPHTSHVCLLIDKIQDWGMYLFTISYGSYPMDQRSGDGWFSGWFKVFVIYSWYFNAEFWSTWCEDYFSTEQNHP